MNVSVGLMEACDSIDVDLIGNFVDSNGRTYGSGRHQFASEIVLTPADVSSAAFAFDAMTIGIGFQWERKERQVFRGSLRIVRRSAGLTAINDVPLEDY